MRKLTEKLSNLLKVTQLGTCRANLARLDPGRLAPS